MQIKETHFPDGQPHLQVLVGEGPFATQQVDLAWRIRTPTDLFKLELISESLEYQGAKK